VLPLPGEALTSRKQRLHLKFQSHTLTPEKFPALVQGISRWSSATIMGLGGVLLLVPLKTLMILDHKGLPFIFKARYKGSRIPLRYRTDVKTETPVKRHVKPATWLNAVSY
jgi:hypothetical protein